MAISPSSSEDRPVASVRRIEDGVYLIQRADGKPIETGHTAYRFPLVLSVAQSENGWNACVHSSVEQVKRVTFRPSRESAISGVLFQLGLGSAYRQGPAVLVEMLRQMQSTASAKAADSCDHPERLEQEARAKAFAEAATVVAAFDGWVFDEPEKAPSKSGEWTPPGEAP